MLGSLQTAVLLLDHDLTCAFLNSAAENLFGVSERQVLGRPVGAVLQAANDLVALCHRVLKSGTTFRLRELELRVADRHLKLDCHATPLEYDGGVLLEFTDTERDRQLRRDADLVTQQQLSRRMVAQLAHEIRNPLGGLRGAAQLLERQLPGQDLKRYTRVIIEEADRLNALVDNILKAGGAPRQEPTNIHQITEHVAKLIAAEKPDGVALVRDYDPSLPPLNVDRSQMIQAFLNLARNALEAVGSSGRLVFRTRALSNYNLGGEQHRLVLSAEVEDSGPGIPDDLKETIFYPLVTGRTTGTGLGLTIAQDLVSRNGGVIEFTSQPGRTVFHMRLPVQNGGGGGKA